MSDRWHLVKNLAACVSVQLTQSLTQLRRAEQAETNTTQGQHQRHSHPRTRTEKRTQQARQAERTARYEQIMALHKQGMVSAEIALHLECLTERFATGSATSSHRSLPDLPARTLATRVSKGEHNWKENGDAKGYQGSPRAIYRYLETLEALSFSARKSGSPSATKPLNPLVTLSAQQATWLFFRRPEDLKQEERETLRQLRQASPHLEAAYYLVETFLQMVRERTGEQLDAWLSAVQASHLEAFTSFVTGIQQDKDAVLAGLSLPWSNGPLEGNVNRLKLIKRSMYGRAEIDLLKLRVLSHSKKGQDRKNKRNTKQQKSLKNSASSLHATPTEISQVA